MGRFVRNQFGQEVYVPSVEERGGPSLGSVPFQPPSPSDRESQYEDFRFNEEQNEQRRRQEDYARREQERERERQLRESEGYRNWSEYQDRFHELYRQEKESDDYLVYLNERAEEYPKVIDELWNNKESYNEAVEDVKRDILDYKEKIKERVLDKLGMPPERPRVAQTTGRVLDRDKAQEQAAERQQILQETDSRRRKELEKHQQRRSRRDALLNSPEAREMAGKVRQGTVSEEDFKTWWVSQQDSTNAHAWDVSIEGDAYQELWAQINQDSITSRMAGDLSGKTKERGGLGGAMGGDAYPVPDPETRAEVLDELEAEHNQREAGSQNPKPFDRNSYETFNLLKERMRSIAASEVVRHKEVRPIGTEAFPGQSGETAIKTIYSDPETEQQDALETYLKVNANGFSDEQASPEDIANLAQTARSLANKLVLDVEGIADADERQRVFQQSLDLNLKDRNLPALTPEVKDELFGRGVMAVTGAQNDVRDSIASLKGVQRDFRLSSEILKTNVDTNNAVDRSSKAYRTLGVSWFKNVDHGKEVKEQLALKEERTRLMDKISSVFQNPELPVSVRKKAGDAYKKLHGEYKQYDNDINYDSYVSTFASQTKMSEEEVRQKFSKEEVGQYSRTAWMNASAVQAEWLDEIAGVIGKGAAISYLLAPFYGVDEASKKVGTLTLTPFAAASHAAVSFFNNATGIAAAFDPGLVGTASGMQKFLDTNQRAFEILEGEKFGKLAGEYVVGGIREAGTSFWQLMFAGSLGMGIKGISALYGLSQFGETYIRAQRMGLPDDMAFAHAHLSGLAESLPQLALPGLNRYAAVIAKGGWQRGMAGGIKKYRDFLFKQFLPTAGIELAQENITTFFQLLSTGLFMTDDPKKYLGDNLGKALFKTSLVTAYMVFMAAGGQAAQQKRMPAEDTKKKERAAFINATRQSVNEAYVNLDALADAVNESGYVDGVNLEQIHGLNPVAAKEFQRRPASRKTVKILLGDKISQKLTTREARENFARNLIEYATESGETARQAIREEQGAPEPRSQQTVRDSQGNTHDIVVPAIIPEDVQDYIDENVQDNNGQPVEIVDPAAETSTEAEAPAEAPTEAETVAEPDPVVQPEVDESSELLGEIESLQKDQNEEVKAWKKKQKREGGKKTSVSGNTLQQKLNSALKVIGITAEQALDGNVLLSSYRQKTKSAHPDRGGTPKQFKAVQDAYDLLQAFPSTIKRSTLKKRRKGLLKTPATEALAEAPTEAAPETAPVDTAESLDAKLVPQLKAQLKEMGVKRYSGKNKAGLIKMILEAQAPTEAAKEPWEMTRADLEKRGKQGKRAKDSDALIDYGEVGEARITWGGEVEILQEIPINQIEYQESVAWKQDAKEFSGQKGEVPPVQVVREGNKYRVEDGHHRIKAAKQKGDTTIKAWVSELAADARIKTHQEIVQQALAEGKPVPAEVLAEYPDLAPTEAAEEIGETYIDEMGVRVKDVPLAKGVDAGIADHLQAINDAGFKTVQSMSGLKADYPSGERYSSNGYMAFMKDENDAKKLQRIRKAAEEAGLPVYDQDIFFQPALVVRTGLTNDGTPFGVLLEQANEKADAKFPNARETDAFVTDWWPYRNKIRDQLVEAHGGSLEDDAVIAKLWDDFTKNLTRQQPDESTTPTEATPAEKQQQKVDAAKQELKDALADVVRNPKILSGVPISDQQIRAAKAVVDYLYEKAVQLGISAKEAAKQLYKDFNVKRGDDSAFDKQVSSAILKVDRRLKQESAEEPPKEKPHTIRKNDDGTFTLVSPLGTEVGVFKTLDRAKEAQKLIEQPGKTTPTPEGEFSDEVYSIKNANVDADLEALNLPKPAPAETLAFNEAMDEAATATEQDADSLVTDLLDNPRAPSPWEDALLNVAYMRAKKNYDNAKKRLAEVSGQGGEAESNAKKDLDAAHKKYEDVYMASRLTGRESGRSLAFRRMMIREDYSLVNMEYEARISNEGELSKKQKEEVAELQKRIEELQSQLSDVESRRNNNKAEEKFKAEDEKIRRQTKRRKPGKAKIVTDDARDAAIERIKKRRQTTLTSGVNPEDIYDATLIGVNLLENGVNKFAAWSSQIVEIVGDTIKPHLKDMWKDARSQVAQVFVDETSSTLAQANKDEKPINYNRQARKIYKEFVAMGQDMSTALKSTHEVFNDAVEEDFTIEQVRDFVSGYGVWKELSKEDLEVRVRDDVGQYQQLAKIEALLRGDAPKKTGVERREASDEERLLMKEVERLKKAGNYIDAEQTLKSAFASMKTRLENQIKDLDNARDLETPIDKRSKLQLTKEQQDEIDEITKRLDIAKELYKEMFPPETKKLDDQDRLAAAIKRTEQRIEKLEDHIERGVPIDEPSTVEPNEELRKLQEKRDKLTQEYRQMAPVKEAAEERKLAAALKQTEESIEDLRNALATGKAIPKSAQPLVNDALNKLRAERDQLREQYKKRFPSPRKLMTDQQKIEREIKNTERSIEQLEQALKNKTPLERKQAGPTNKKLDALRKKRADLRTRYNKEIGAAQKLERDIKAAEQTISEMETALRTGKPLPKRPKGKVDPVLAKIHERRDEVRRRYREKFPPTRTAAKRIAYAEKALERAIERNKKRIRDKDIGPVKGKKARSARLDALRAENEALLAELRALRPKLTQEQKDTRRKIAEIQRKIKQRKQALASGEYKTEQRQSEANMKDPTLQKLIAAEKQLSLQFKAEFGPQMALDQEKARVKRRIADTRARIASGQFSTEKKSPQEKKDDDEMRQLRLEEMNAKREFNALKAKYEWDNMGVTSKASRVGLRLYDAVRGMKASWDFSGFRQAAFASLAQPRKALRAGGKMFVGAWSEKQRLAIEDELRKHPRYDEAKQRGIAFTEVGGDLTATEEEYMFSATAFSGKTWGVLSYPYAVSERAFSTLLNVMRLEYYVAIADGLPLTAQEQKDLALHVNDATGRGGTGPNSEVITRLIWSPRLLLSRWNLLTFRNIRDPDVSWKVKKLILKQYARAMRSVGVLLLLAAGSRWGDDWEEWLNFIDPRSSKFATIKIGNTYVDPWGGMKQLAVFIARIAPGLPFIPGSPTKRNWEGELVPLDEGVYGQNVWGEISRFTLTKLNPALGVGISYAQKSDMMGRPMTEGRAMYELIAPLAPQEGLVAIKEEGLVTGTFLGLLGMMGASLMIDDEENLSSYEQILDMLGLDPLEGPKEKRKAERERQKIIDARRKKRTKK